MKRLVAFILLVFLTGCSAQEHVSVAEFRQAYAMAGQPQSMKSVEFLGVRAGRAFLKIRSMPIVGSKWKERLVYVELTEVDAEFRDALTKRPNQSLEPTTMLGTSAAEQPLVPSIVVAHL